MRNLRLVTLIGLLSVFGRASVAFGAAMPVQFQSVTLLSAGSALHAGATGDLLLTEDQIKFVTAKGEQVILRGLVSSVSAERQLIERGGKFGTIMRMGIPYGGGAALALMSPKHVALVTLEYKEGNTGTHHIVFSMPETEAANFLDHFPKPEPVKPQDKIPLQPRKEFCSAFGDSYRMVGVIPIVDPKSSVPIAYKALLHEDLIDRLSSTKEVSRVIRPNSAPYPAACPQTTVEVSMSSYSAGNQMVRAATGLFGMFVDTASIEYQLTVRSPHGEVLISEPLKNTLRGDRQDTGVAGQMSKRIAKQIKKLVDREGKRLSE